jgi:hypothetical protein
MPYGPSLLTLRNRPKVVCLAGSAWVLDLIIAWLLCMVLPARRRSYPYRPRLHLPCELAT